MANVDSSALDARTMTDLQELVLIAIKASLFKMENALNLKTILLLLTPTVQLLKIMSAKLALKTSSSDQIESAQLSIPFAKPTTPKMEHAQIASQVTCSSVPLVLKTKTLSCLIQIVLNGLRDFVFDAQLEHGGTVPISAKLSTSNATPTILTMDFAPAAIPDLNLNKETVLKQCPPQVATSSTLMELARNVVREVTFLKASASQLTLSALTSIPQPSHAQLATLATPS